MDIFDDDDEEFENEKENPANVEDNNVIREKSQNIQHDATKRLPKNVEKTWLNNFQI